MSRVAVADVAFEPNEQSSWLRAFDTFGVAFVVYGDDGRRAYVSTQADVLIAACPLRAAALRRVDRLVPEHLAQGDNRLHIGTFAPTRDMSIVAAGLAFDAYTARRNTDGIGAVVVLRRQSAPAAGHIPDLTPRQDEIARLIAAGLATKQIAFRLGISTHTARHHTERLFARLGVRTRAGVAAIVGAGPSRPEWIAE